MRKLCRLLCLQLTVRGAPHPGPCLVAANHISWLDIPLLLSYVDGAFVSKAEIARWPIIGGLADSAHTLYIRRGQTAHTNKIATQMQARFSNGGSVIIFPEATTSDGHALKKFHGRLYQPAIDTGVVVQPVALIYYDADGQRSRLAPLVDDINLLRHLWRLLGAPPLTAQIIFCPALQTFGQDRRSLVTASYAAIAAKL